MLSDWSLASGVASASAGIELKNNIVIVLGNAEEATGDCIIAHAVMQDAIDAGAVIKAMRCVGHDGADEEVVDAARIVNVLANADPSPDGLVRGWRHTCWTIPNISATRHCPRRVRGVIAGLTGCPAVFVSGRGGTPGSTRRRPGGGDFAGVSAAGAQSVTRASITLMRSSTTKRDPASRSPACGTCSSVRRSKLPPP